MTANERAARYRARHPERVKASQARYLKTKRGRAMLRRKLARYRRRAYADPARRARMLASWSAWRARNKGSYNAWYRTFWLKSPKGRAHKERNNLGLTKEAPPSLVRSIRLLGTLRREIRA